MTVVAGGQTFTYNFEIPPSEESTVTSPPVTHTPTGGLVAVNLHASPLAAGPVTFAVATSPARQAPLQVTLQPGQSTTVQLAVPFGSTTVTVSAEGVVIFTHTATVTAPTAPPSTTAAVSTSAPPAAAGAPVPPAGGEANGVLANTGNRQLAPTALAAAALIAVGSMLLALGLSGRREELTRRHH